MKKNMFTSAFALRSRVSTFLKAALILVFAFGIFAAFSITGFTENKNSKPVNLPPVAGDDTFSGTAARHQNSPGLLANDYDLNGDTLVIDTTLVTNPQHGWALIWFDGTYDYIPTNGWTGDDTFEYRVCDRPDGHPDRLCSTATVTVQQANTAPVAAPDFYLGWSTGFSVSQAKIGVLANDSDINGDFFQVDPNFQTNNPAAAPAHGWVSFYIDGKFDYVMTDPGFTGVDSFQYRICDTLPNYTPGACSVGTVYVWVLTTDRPLEDAGCPKPKKPDQFTKPTVKAPNSFGRPVNVTNGNMYLQQTDYALPGIGENINVTRTYNSITQNAGVLGLGWTIDYDENVYEYAGASVIRLLTADAKAVYFGSTGANQPFVSLTAGFYGQITKNTSGSYTLTHKDGSVHQFNSSGRLTSMTDRNGNQTTINYDTSNRLASVVNPFNKTVTFTYDTVQNEVVLSDSAGTVATYKKDQFNRLESVTYPDGSKYVFTYTTRTLGPYTLHLLTEVKDALNNIVEKHDYDSSGRATTSEVDGGAEKFTANYSNSSLVVVTDALQRETKYHISTIGSRKVVTKVEGLCGCGGSNNQTTEYEYDYKLNVTKKTDGNNHQTTYGYDANGNMLSETDVTGTRSYTYNSYGQILTATDQMNGVATITYNAQGRPTEIKDPLNKTTTLDYFTTGELKSITDARNKTTNFLWEDGNLKRVTDADGKQTNFTYNARGQKETTTNALNEVTTYQYDLNRRLKKIINPDTKFVEYKYDLAGRIEWIQDARGNKTNFGYDPLSAYRVKTVTDPLNHTNTYGYDLMSNLTSVTDADGKTTDYTIDAFNRVSEITYPPATTGATRLKETYTFDNVGHIKTHTDTANRVTTYDYDSAERLWKITNPESEVTQFEYNARSQRTKVKDALNQQYVFTYDALGRQLTQTRGGSTMSYEYDDVGNVIKRTDYTGRMTTYSYDNMNRLATTDYLDTVAPHASIETVTYTYDDLSRLLTATNYAGTVSFTYDNRSRIATTTDVHGSLLEYEYDGNGNRTLLKLDGQNHTSYAYDAANRLTTLTDEANQNFTFAYDVTNRLTSKTLPNNVVTTYNYDGLSRLTRLKHEYGTTALVDNQYAYNTAQQISQITELAQTRTFTYDNADRLTASTNPLLGNESYSYDDVGNRTASHLSSTYGYQGFNQLITSDTVTYDYDANGNRVSKSDGSTFGGFYQWDYENRLTAAKNPNSSWSVASAGYQYDALGRKVSRTYYAHWEKYTYDGFDVVLDQSKGGGATYQNAPGIDNKLKINQGGNENYFLPDHLGSTIGLTDATGSVVVSENYDSFGNSTNSLDTRYRYTGREYDYYSGLYYYRARWYDPNLGRFASEDPIGFDGGDINLYAYVGNNPGNKIDPTGETEEGMIWRLQYHQDPGTREYVAIWDSCMADCLLSYGAAAVAGYGGFVFGQPMTPKPFVTQGSSSATSPISSTLARRFPQKLPSRVWAPTLNRPFAKSNNLGRVVGRWIPYVGAVVMVADFYLILSCTNQCYDEACIIQNKN